MCKSKNNQLDAQRKTVIIRLNPLLSKRFHTIITRNRIVIAFLFVSLQPFGNCGYQIISKGKEYLIINKK